jgi:hypothetical protein
MHEATSPLAGRPAESYGFADVLYEKRDWVARVTINRPEVYNSYTTATLVELRDAFRDAAHDDGVAVVVLTGAGDKAFCTGGDVKEYAGEFTRRPHDYWKYMGLFAEALDALRNVGKPTIARLNGIVAGGGNEWNMACDRAVAADDVTSAMHAGILPPADGGRRPRGRRRRTERSPLRADHGRRSSRASSSGSRGGLDTRAELTEPSIGWCAPTRQQVNFWKDFAWNMTIGHAREWLALHFANLEPWEGMTAFVEKRPPEYRRLRELARDGGSSETLWGPPAKSCAACGTQGLPAVMRFCGVCGQEL